MKIPIYQVDAFTDELFKGNSAAVCPLEKWLEDEVMQSIAAENNLSETAFYVKSGDGFDIRWFTPKVEIDLAGHPTLATAHVIFNHRKFNGDEITFFSKRGELKVKKVNNMIQLDFPAAESKKVSPPEELIRGLGTTPKEVFKSRDYLAVLESEEEVLAINPDFQSLKMLDSFGIIVTARGNRSDFVSRFFAPNAGIDEDPVTGSAHTMLIPFWANQLNQNKLHALQISKRGGKLFCEYHGDRVYIGGQAITYLVGEIEV